MFNRLLQTPKSRAPWLLLWLVPYLFLSVAGESLHNHGFGSLSHAAHATPSEQPASQPVAQDGDSSAPSHAIFDADCLACHWSSFAAIAPAGVSPVAPPQRLAIAPQPSLLAVAADAAFVSTRGPPLS